MIGLCLHIRIVQLRKHSLLIKVSTMYFIHALPCLMALQAEKSNEINKILVRNHIYNVQRIVNLFGTTLYALVISIDYTKGIYSNINSSFPTLFQIWPLAL